MRMSYAEETGIVCILAGMSLLLALQPRYPSWPPAQQSLQLSQATVASRSLQPCIVNGADDAR